MTNSSSHSNCVACPSNCIVCTSSSVPACLTCNVGFYLSLGTCVSNCSGGFLPDYINECSSCLCLSCSNTAYNCTSCSGATNLFNFQCLTTCPSGYYASNNTCLACTANCASCSSSTNCLICYLPNVLLISSSSAASCLSSCPNGTINTINPSNFSYICSACTKNCLTC